jgi:hypothetical protein
MEKPPRIRITMKFNHAGFDVPTVEPLPILSVLPPASPTDTLTGVIYHRTCDVTVIVKLPFLFDKGEDLTGNLPPRRETAGRSYPPVSPANSRIFSAVKMVYFSSCIAILHQEYIIEL